MQKTSRGSTVAKLLFPPSPLTPPCLFPSLLSSYFLERSNSVRITLKRAKELFPIEVSLCTSLYQEWISSCVAVCWWALLMVWWWCVRCISLASTGCACETNWKCVLLLCTMYLDLLCMSLLLRGFVVVVFLCIGVRWRCSRGRHSSGRWPRCWHTCWSGKDPRHTERATHHRAARYPTHWTLIVPACRGQPPCRRGDTCGWCRVRQCD